MYTPMKSKNKSKKLYKNGNQETMGLSRGDSNLGEKGIFCCVANENSIEYRREWST